MIMIGEILLMLVASANAVVMVRHSLSKTKVADIEVKKLAVLVCLELALVGAVVAVEVLRLRSA